IGLFWLAGFRNLPIAFYSLFLSFFFFASYLVYQYIRHRQFYKLLTDSVKTLDESLQQLDRAPISQSLTHLLRTQYNEYKRQMTQMSKKQEEHLIFMDRWIHQMKTPISVIDLAATELDEP